MGRIETGALQINDDWTGLYIRGDDAFMLKEILAKAYIRAPLTGFDRAIIGQLMNMIMLDVDDSKVVREVRRISAEDK